MKDISIIIPSRNEMFLRRTIDDILLRHEVDIEIIAVLDGVWDDIPQNPLVNVIYLSESIGQRAATNMGVKLAQGKYVIKCDAHCAFEQGFDRKMLEALKKTGDNVCMVPIMRNLWAFDWKCYRCGWKTYQGRTPEMCPTCKDRKKVRRKMMWIGKERPQSTSYCFDSEPHFQYNTAWSKRPEVRQMIAETGLSETMSLQGSFFMCTKEKYQELNICDEEFGSWGNQGIEVACKFWLSGGRVLCNHNTWYAHMFRTQGGDFGFPYEQHGREVAKCKEKVKDLFFNNKWDKAIHPLSWLVERFMPVANWTQELINNLKK